MCNHAQPGFGLFLLMYLYINMCLHLEVRVHIGCLLSFFSPYFVKQAFSVNLKSMDWLGYLDSKQQGSYDPWFPMLE